jgi:hypothetical protein
MKQKPEEFDERKMKARHPMLMSKRDFLRLPRVARTLRLVFCTSISGANAWQAAT